MEERVRTRSTGFNVNVHTTTPGLLVRLNMTIAVMVTPLCVLMVNVKMRFARILASIIAVFATQLTTFRTSQRIPHVTRLVQFVQLVSIEKIVGVQISVNRVEYAHHARIFP